MKYKMIAILFVFVFIGNLAHAHSGRTDASGCHKNSKTGIRHCHNAKPQTPAPNVGNNNDRPQNTQPQGDIFDKGTFQDAIAVYHFENARDSAGVLNGVLLGNASLVQPSKIGKGLKLINDGAFATLGSSRVSVSDLSIVAWVKAQKQSSNFSMYIKEDSTILSDTCSLEILPSGNIKGLVKAFRTVEIQS